LAEQIKLQTLWTAENLNRKLADHLLDEKAWKKKNDYSC
jgi:hypothetical protein